MGVRLPINYMTFLLDNKHTVYVMFLVDAVYVCQ